MSINDGNDVFKEDCKCDQLSHQQAEITRKICIETINSIISYCFSRLRRPDSEIAFSLENGYHIIREVQKIFEKEKAVLEISTKSTSDQENDEKSDESSKIVVVGDLHGNIDSLMRIFSKEGYPSSRKYLFLGDFVDRGMNGCEVLIILYAHKILYPNNVYIIRGNHEFKGIATIYGFKSECIKRIPSKFIEGAIYDGFHFFNQITDTFQYLPLCAIVNESIFCVHGGITAHLENKKQLLSIRKASEHYNDDFVHADFLWNDPKKDIEYSYDRNVYRKIGYFFNQVALDSFLKTMGFSMVIRGHQVCSDGFDFPFGENSRIVTVFSSNDYCGRCNDAAVAFISDDNEVSIRKFISLEKEKTKVLIAPLKMFDLNKNVFLSIDKNDVDLNSYQNNTPISI